MNELPRDPVGSAPVVATSSSLVSWTQFIYGLHAFSLLTGILGAATVVGAFLTGWPSIIAVILNYVKRGEVRGTWLESHFRWQIRTFWFGLLWVSLCLLFVVATFGIGILIAWLPLALVGFWFIYRIIRGWMALSDRRPMYSVETSPETALPGPSGRFESNPRSRAAAALESMNVRSVTSPPAPP